MHFALVTFTVATVTLAVAAHRSTGQSSGMAIPITKHSTLVNADKTVNVDALRSHGASVNAKILRNFENYERNTGMRHPCAMAEVRKRGTGEPLTADNTELWYGNISVGNPPQTFTVAFDTGSSDLFLAGAVCPTCVGHHLWNASSSSTSNDLGLWCFLTFGDGGLAFVNEYTDTVYLAEYTATNQTLGVATLYSTEFQSPLYPADGLMGMGFQSISRFNANPVFQTLVSEGDVTDPVFSVMLSTSGSELYIGGSNPALYTGSFTYTPVTTEGYWQVVMDVLGEGKTILSNVAAAIDTGTTFIAGPSSDVSTLYQALGGTLVPNFSDGSNVYTLPCNSFPNISFSFGGTTFPISASTLNLAPADDINCICGITGEDSASMWIVGDVFLRNVYTTFDVGNLRVGFAQLA